MNVAVSSVRTNLPALPSRAARRNISPETALADFNRCATPSVYSLGAVKNKFAFVAMLAALANQISYSSGLAIFGFFKLVGKLMERSAVKQLAEQIKSPDDQARVMAAIDGFVRKQDLFAAVPTLRDNPELLAELFQNPTEERLKFKPNTATIARRIFADNAAGQKAVLRLFQTSIEATLSPKAKEHLAAKLQSKGILLATPQEIAIVKYRNRAMPHFYSLGSAKAAFAVFALPFLGISAISCKLYQFTTIAAGLLFGAFKLAGKLIERSAVKQVAAQVTSPEDKEKLIAAMQLKLQPGLQERLTKQLSKKGVMI
jgi:hypothetical protein